MTRAFVQVVRMVAVEGKGVALLESLERAADAARNEAGTLGYVIHRDIHDPDVLWIYESYASERARDLHSGSQATDALRQALSSHLGAPTTVHRMIACAGFGITTNELHKGK